jgi:RNA polymerase sigma factor (sigma-70 family)
MAFLNYDRIDKVVRKYIELRKEAAPNMEVGRHVGMFNPKFISRLAFIVLDTERKTRKSVCKKEICDKMRLDYSFKPAIETAIKLGLVPGFKIKISGSGRKNIVRTLKKINTRAVFEFDNYKNYCMKILSPLVLRRVCKYKNFSNYEDLKQDGFEALLLALNTYDPDKGAFTWWAGHYIKTRVSRAANTHSTIRFPLQKTKEFIPHKESYEPIVIDKGLSPLKNAEEAENKRALKNAMESLSKRHRAVINMTFGLNNTRPKSVNDIAKTLSITHSEYLKLMRESKKKMKKALSIVR